MNFDRAEVQTYLEKKLGCTNLAAWSDFRDQVNSYQISASDLPLLKDALHRDSGAYLMKGMLSLFEAIASIQKKNYSWSIVKLYYSIFYLNRASLGTKDYALVRNKSWFILKLSTGEKPKIKNGGRFKNDHDAVINTYIELYEKSDYLQSNTVEGINGYEWLSNRRNQINYQQVKFTDPDAPAFIAEWIKLTKHMPVLDILKSYSKNDGTKIFQPEHAWIAIPILRAQHTLQDFADSKLKIIVEKSQFDLLFNQLDGRHFIDPETINNVFKSFE